MNFKRLVTDLLPKEGVVQVTSSRSMTGLAIALRPPGLAPSSSTGSDYIVLIMDTDFTQQAVGLAHNARITESLTFKLKQSQLPRFASMISKNLKTLGSEPEILCGAGWGSPLERLEIAGRCTCHNPVFENFRNMCAIALLTDGRRERRHNRLRLITGA